MTFIATLIANPSRPVLSQALGEKAAHALSPGNLHWLDDGIACDIVLKADHDQQAVRATLDMILGDLPIDVVIQNQTDRRKKLLIADMDSTMIEQECVDELAVEIGIGEKVAAITRQAMNGEIDFEAALRQRVALLAGLPAGVIDKLLAERITLTPGGATLVATMTAHGAYTALVSGGFTAFTGPIAARLGFHENRANRLIIENGLLNGQVEEPILGRQAKVDALNEIVSRFGWQPQDALAVGDGANDLAMLAQAGSGVALHAKPAVARQAAMRIDHGDLTALLYLQGYRGRDFVAPSAVVKGMRHDRN